MTSPKNAPRKPTAAELLRTPSAHPAQLELLGSDIDLGDLYLSLNHKSINIVDAVADVRAQRTIEGASTITVTVADQDKILLKSGRLSSKNDIVIDGLHFRMVGVKKQGLTLKLVFEELPIAVLRTYSKPIKQALSTSRVRTTRAQFALRLIREVKELPKIPVMIPELNKVQPIADTLTAATEAGARQHDRSLGIAKTNVLTVKTNQMSENQRKVANAILDVGASMVLPRKCLVMAIMCGIQESSLTNLLMGKPGDYNFIDSHNPKGNPIGVFQQIPKYWAGPPHNGATRNVGTDAAAFYNALLPLAHATPSGAYHQLVERVQNSGNAQAYAQWRTEAERIVTDYGVIDGKAADANAQWNSTLTTGDYEFYRGIPPTSSYQKKRGKIVWGKENSWDCLQRLAAEVQWRAYFVSGTFYFIAEDDLFKSQPIATIDEDTPGVNSIDGDYDEGTKVATLTVTCFMRRWAAPPGSIVAIKNMGPWNGRWLVNDIERSLFDPEGTITLKKPLPRLPEPSGTNVPKANQGSWTGTPLPDPGQQFRVATKIVQPVPQGYHASIIQGIHPTAGLANHPACDFGADVNAPVVACENGTIKRRDGGNPLTGHDPNSGPSDPLLGVHGPFGWSIYLLGVSGTEYYYTHLGHRSVVAGQKVNAGEVIGQVGNYAKWGGANHAHVGVDPGGSGHPDITDLMNAPLAVAR